MGLGVGHGVMGVTSDALWHWLVLDWPAAGGNGTAVIASASGPAIEPVRIELPPRPGGVVFMICVHVKGFSLRLDELDWNRRGDGNQ